MLPNLGSMILYRVDLEEGKTPALSSRSFHLVPQKLPSDTHCACTASSTSSLRSLDKYNYESAFPTIRGGLVPYEYDPTDDLLDPIDDEDRLHDPEARGVHDNRFPWRGIFNVGVLILLVLSLLYVFIFCPIFFFYLNEARNHRMHGNIHINATGQSPVLFQMPDLIDLDTPTSAKTRTGFDNYQYDLVFSDEFNRPGRTFYPGDDPFWEAVSLRYGSTGDLERYDPSQVTTRNGSLVITMDSTTTTQSRLTPNSTAPFTEDQNYHVQYRSGMLQSWNKFCFTTGYIEVSVVFPGPNENTQGYWPGAWTMGNLARPGYVATTEGIWPYSYNTCDLGTFPNQTLKTVSRPAASLHSGPPKAGHNTELSWLPGQRVSACSCPGSDHPGPIVSQGRGSPEIDILEAEKDREATGQVVSQSGQFAPFTHDYLFGNSTADQFTIYTPAISRANPYRGNAQQQTVSTLTTVPSDMFQCSGSNFKTLGFEYWTDPSTPTGGFITWQVDGNPTSRLGATALGPDQGEEGSGVGQRLISEEPMSIVLNLGISPSWQTIDLSTMIFPAEYLVDYVRVYQRKDHTNIGCNPKAYPTADYINNHLEAYQNPNLPTWSWPKPKNSLYDGC